MDDKNIQNFPWKLLGFAILVILLALAYKWAENEKAKKTVEIAEFSVANLNAETGYLQVTLNPRTGEALQISGWKIGLDNSQIPLVRASALPYQGKINSEQAVTITVPTTLIISLGHSPIGVSFRENKCIGMLDYFQEFVPPLPKQCDKCTETTSSNSNDEPEVNYPDYNACVSAHMSESDFFGNAWRFYLATTSTWTTNNNFARLYDENGKLLDTFKY